MENEIRRFKRRAERDLYLFDFLFVPSSLIRLKLNLEKDLKRKINDWWYVPALLFEGLRLYGYYKLLENYLR